MPGRPADWLYVTVAAVRDAMKRRLDEHTLDAETEGEIRLALDALSLMWEELVGRSESLDREQRRYEEFFDFAPDAYVVTDTGCNVREANLAFAALVGASREELLGKPLTARIVAPDRTPFLARFVGLLLASTDEPVTWRARLQSAEAPVEVSITVRAIPLRRSGVQGLIWLFRPVAPP